MARLATRIGVLHEGRLVDEFDAAALPARVGRHLEVCTRDNARALTVLAAAGLDARGTDDGGLRLDARWVTLSPEAVATTLWTVGCRRPARRRRGGPETYFLRLVGAPARVGRAARCRRARGPSRTARRAVSADLGAALRAEWLKVRHSRVPWASVGAIILAGLVSGFFMFLLQDLRRARSLGLVGSKAQLGAGTADWSGYFSLAAQVVSVGGLIVFGVLAIWLFGREFSDRTAKDLLALPTSRSAVVVAKLLVGLLWCLALTALLVAVTLVLGLLLRLPGWSPLVALRGAGLVLAGC